MLQMLRTLLYELRRIWPLLLVIALAIAVFGDPAGLTVQLYTLSMLALVLIVTHLVRKSLYPYLDLSELVARAKEDPLASAVVFASIIGLVISLLMVGTVRAAEIPERARPLLPVLSELVDEHWPEAPLPHLLAGKVEQESSWKERATLKTSRELGRGLGQITIAYRSDGTERFNSYLDAIRYSPLKDWDWEADPYNVRHQLTYVVLRSRAEYQQMRPMFEDDVEASRAALVCYNAGKGRVLQRRAYALANAIPADRWEAPGLEMAHGPGEDRVLYGRPLWQLVNEYPHRIFWRAMKYEGKV